MQESTDNSIPVSNYAILIIDALLRLNTMPVFRNIVPRWQGVVVGAHFRFGHARILLEIDTRAWLRELCPKTSQLPVKMEG